MTDKTEDVKTEEPDKGTDSPTEKTAEKTLSFCSLRASARSLGSSPPAPLPRKGRHAATTPSEVQQSQEFHNAMSVCMPLPGLGRHP